MRYLHVSAWYYPYAFYRLVAVSRLEATAFAREGLAVVVAAIFTSLAFASITAHTWPGLIICVAGFCLGYAFLLTLLSKGFRAELFSLLHPNKQRILQN